MRQTKIVLLVAVMLAPGSGTVWADPAAGAKVFQVKRCQDCHYTDGPAKEKTIADQLAKKGPELWYAGSKFQKAWLGKWLQDPKPIRALKYNSLTAKNAGDHPKLAGPDAAAVTDFLMSLVSKDVKAGVVKPKMNPKGRLVFTKSMPCSGCHQFPGQKFTGGLNGPSLRDAGERLNPDWIFAYLKDAKTFKPVRQMPVFAGLLNEKDMQAVAEFVSTFK
ncbi:MAG: c-type cytochrome [Betaproteobacteria bacterium]|nr:c-type cytochrome [Betaproteobacteria bacterium]